MYPLRLGGDLLTLSPKGAEEGHSGCSSACEPGAAVPAPALGSPGPWWSLRQAPGCDGSGLLAVIWPPPLHLPLQRPFEGAFDQML